MRSSIVLLASFASVSFAQTTYQTIVADLQAITKATNTLTADAGKVKGGIGGVNSALQIQVDAVSIHELILSSISDAQASSAFGSSGTTAVLNQLTQLQQPVNASITTIENQKSNFGDLSPVVLASLYQLQQDTNKFAIALVPKLDSSQINAALAQYQTINDSFEDGIVFYGGVEQCEFGPSPSSIDSGPLLLTSE